VRLPPCGRRAFLKTAAAAGAAMALDLAGSPAARGGETMPQVLPPQFNPAENIIPAPDDPAQWPAFRTPHCICT
jgi:hypothetical protein